MHPFLTEVIFLPLAACAVSLPMVILVHELGHLAVAKCVGFKVLSLCVGPMVALKNNQGWKLHFDWNISAGMVHCQPTSLDNLRTKWLLTFAAGPVASILFGLAALFLYQQAPDSQFGNGFGICALWSFLVSVTSLWPRQGTIKSDGLQILMLLRGGKLPGFAPLDTSKRPRDWGDGLISTVSHNDSAGARLSIQMLAYARALDSGKFADAGACLDRAAIFADQLPSLSLASWYFESAYFEARHRNNAAKARDYLEGAHNLSRVDEYAIPRCRAAVLIAEGKYDEARQALADARSMLDAGVKTGDTAAEYDLVRDLETQLEQLQKT
jgi:hypothetical protein